MMKRLFFFLLLTTSLSAQNWVEVANDGRSRYYVANDQIQRDDGGLKFFVKKTFSPPIYDQGKTVDETLTIWWVGCSNDQYKLGPTFEYRNGQQIGVQSGTYSWTSIQRNTGIPIVENRNRAFDFVCRSSR
jgi:hypothetical protein